MDLKGPLCLFGPAFNKDRIEGKSSDENSLCKDPQGNWRVNSACGLGRN